MPYLTCVRCGLTIRTQVAFLTLENCPRCLARSGVVSPLSPTDPPAPRADGTVGAGRRPGFRTPYESDPERVVAGPLTMRCRRRRHGWVVSLTGELDVSCVAALREEIERIARQRPSSIVLDLSHLDFLDSTGLREILRIEQRLRGGPTRLLLRRGPERVQRVFALTRTEQQLPFEPSAVRTQRSTPAPRSQG